MEGQQKERGVVGIGAVLADRIFYGTVPEDGKIQIPAETPYPDEKYEVAEAGGPAFWAVATIKALSHGEINPKFISVIGGVENDPLRGHIKDAGIDVNYLVTIPNAFSARSIVTIDDKDPRRRHIKWSPSPAKLKPEDIESRRESVFFNSIPIILHLDCREELASPTATNIVREQNPDCMVYMDTGDLKEHTLELIGQTKPNVIQMPKRCAVQLCQSQNIESKQLSLGELAERVRKIVSTEAYKPQFLVVTDGENGSGYCYDDSDQVITGFQKAYKINTADSNGAGDVFAGGISYARQILGLGWEEADKFASAVAAVKCQRMGRTGNIPSADNVTRAQLTLATSN